MTIPYCSFSSRRALFLAAAIAMGLGSPPATAQMQLPGAFAPAPAGTVTAPTGAASKPRPKKSIPAAPKVPSDDKVIGRILMLNGRAGAMEFRRDGANLQLTGLKLAGDQMSRTGDVCVVDLGATPISLKAAGQPAGVTRYEPDLPSCPFSIDVLDGAALVQSAGGACEFKAADCRVDPTGLWGQPANEIGPQRAKDIESERRRAEQTMRANFKSWISSASGNRALVTRIAREQAAFSSRREELCRSYARESQHGYCALVATEARSSAIAARILPPGEQPDDGPTTVAKKKPRKR